MTRTFGVRIRTSEYNAEGIHPSALAPIALGFILAPGESVAPGVVLLIGGAGVLIAGVAVVVVVLRMLLAQAVARDAEAQHLQDELDEVI